MSDFDLAIPIILAHEGTPTNFWVDDPLDAGGETVWGISMLMIRGENVPPSELGLTAYSPGCLKNVDLAYIKNVYKKYFWDRFGCGNINSQLVATKHFDCIVNCGPHNGTIIAQNAANSLGSTLGVDGSMGPMSFAAINSYDPQTMTNAMGAAMANYYNAIVKAHPSQVRFLSNWLHRANWGVK